jgi:predicted nucleic acid-binding protein
MPQNRILIDSSFLFALYNRSDEDYKIAQAFAAKQTNMIFIVPDVTLPEVTFLFNRHGKIPAVINFLQSFAAAQPHLEPIQVSDIERAYDIMTKYADSKFDFVDCCIMALAERLDITQICTFDHRDFSIFRPSHCDHLQLLP